jgi:hypothetical protein
VMATVASGLETTAVDFGNRYFITTDGDGKGNEESDGNGGDPNHTNLRTAPTGTTPQRTAGTSLTMTSTSDVDPLFSDTSILASLRSI